MSSPLRLRPVLKAIAAELPPDSWTTEELLSAAGSRFTPRLRGMLGQLGVEVRHSVLANYSDVLFRNAEPELRVSGSTLAVRAARHCMQNAGLRPNDIGLVLGVTSSPSRLLPSLVCDLFVQMPELPRDIPNFSVTYMGCSAISKVIDLATWFLTVHPDQYVLVCFMDSITPLSPVLSGNYAHFNEVDRAERQSTVNALHGFLFGDAAVAMAFSASGVGPSFGPVTQLTNEDPGDAELGTVPDGGSDLPVVYGRRLYTLSPDVGRRGLFYATETVNRLFRSGDTLLQSAGEASMLLMHTGSLQILDSLCEGFDISPADSSVSSSYSVLRRFGNTIGCSVPLMLADPVHRGEGEGLMVAFGLSFSCGASSITIPKGGWRA